MPFDLLGTFNRSQFDRLVAYARSRLVLIDARIQHLEVEMQRTGFLLFKFSTDGKPESYQTGREGSNPTYIGRLMGAYEVLGGDPFFDLQVRPTTQPVSHLKGSEEATSKVLSNGEPMPHAGLLDSPSGNAVRDLKAWMVDDLDRLERLERKIRRAVDYSDQLQTEIDQLRTIRQTVDVEGSLANLESSVQQMLSNPAYRAIADDQGKDPFGKFIYAPLSSYEPGGVRSPQPGVAIERTDKGYTVVGEGSTET
jgi:hypothetical protein